MGAPEDSFGLLVDCLAITEVFEVVQVSGGTKIGSLREAILRRIRREGTQQLVLHVLDSCAGNPVLGDDSLTVREASLHRSSVVVATVLENLDGERPGGRPPESPLP